MTDILVLGGTGYAGAAIVREAASRGHRVTAVSRSAADLPDGVAGVTGDVVAATPDLSGADVVVAALSPRGSNAGALREAYARLADAAADAGVPLVVIGGFSSLRPAEGEPRFADAGSVPEAFAAEAAEMNAVLGDLGARGDGLDWRFVSPAGEFGAHVPGERTGRYRVGGDVALFDEDGGSRISGADFAIAVVDELETPSAAGSHLQFVS